MEGSRGREVVLITGGSVAIRDGLETEKRRPFDPFVFFFFFDELFLDFEGAKNQSPNIFLDVGRRDERGSRSGQIDLKAETNSVLSFRVFRLNRGGGGEGV